MIKNPALISKNFLNFSWSSCFFIKFYMFCHIFNSWVDDNVIWVILWWRWPSFKPPVRLDSILNGLNLAGTLGMIGMQEYDLGKLWITLMILSLLTFFRTCYLQYFPRNDPRIGGCSYVDHIFFQNYENFWKCVSCWSARFGPSL